jgi:hypothetical protein
VTYDTEALTKIMAVKNKLGDTLNYYKKWADNITTGIRIF